MKEEGEMGIGTGVDEPASCQSMIMTVLVLPASN